VGPTRRRRGLAWAAAFAFAALPASGSSDDPSLEEILGGFEDDTAESPPVDSETEAEGDSQRFRDFDLLGSVSLGASYNVRNHRSSIGPDPPPAPGTEYGGLQRLRARADLQADAYLPRNWKGRIQAYVFYDFAYLIHGTEHYTHDVIEDYEFESEILDFWVAGSVMPWLDLKLGRQVVNWGRSDTLRVTDIWNALNNREPGLVDIEELRLPSTMARADAYVGRWQITALVVPEIRYDYNPPPGSDFFPALDFNDLPDAPPGAPPGSKEAVALAVASTTGLSNQAPRWGATPEYGAALSGVFSGWDLSLYAARIYQNQTSSVIGLPDPSLAAAYSIDIAQDRVTMLGAGANYTRGSWLLKAEVAFLDELDYSFLEPNPTFSAPADPPYVFSALRLARLDWLAGLEYYGFGDATVAIDFAHRHVIDYDPSLQYLPNYVYENSFEAALRVGSEFFNARLRVNALGVVLANDAGLQGGILRVWGDYELLEALILTGGYLHYFGSSQVPFDTWEQNDRFFAKVKYSFP
jgi:hypothetical protein